MEKDKIEDTEILYRAVRESNPGAFVDGKPTAALFMDPGGASVDRDGNREEKEIIESFKYRFKKNNDYKTAVKISAGECRTVGTYPTPVGSKIFNAEIWDTEEVKLVSLLKAIQLAKLCSEVIE